MTMNAKSSPTNFQEEVDRGWSLRSSTPGQPQNKYENLKSQPNVGAYPAQLQGKKKLKNVPLHFWRPIVHIT